MNERCSGACGAASGASRDAAGREFCLLRICNDFAFDWIAYLYTETRPFVKTRLSVWRLPAITESLRHSGVPSGARMFCISLESVQVGL